MVVRLCLFFFALGLLLPAVAPAADPGGVALARYHRFANHPREAAAVAAGLLAQDDRDLAAHRVHIEAWIQLGESDVVVAQYAAWHAEAPDDDVRRILHGFTLAADRFRAAERCAEIEALHDPLPEDVELRYYALLTLERIHRRTCPGDTEADRAELMALEGKVPAARTWHLGQRLNAEPVDGKLRGRLKKLIRQEPWRVGVASRLWRDGATGDRLEQARKDALSAARKGVRSDDLAVLDASRRLLAAAGEEEEAEAARARLEELDTAESMYGPMDPLEREISDAKKQLDPDRALFGVEALNDRVPESGPVRARYEDTRAGLLDKLGRGADALAARKAAWEADPSNGSVANEFAWEAVLAGVELEAALAASEDAIAAARSVDWEHGQAWAPGWEAWVERRSTLLGNYEDTRAWVLHALGRHADAAEVIRSAVMHNRDAGVLHLHAGLIYRSAGDDVAAAEHLAIGLRLTGQSEPELVAQGRAALEELYPSLGHWHPEGLDGYLAARAEARRESATAEVGEPTVMATHPLLGKAFPDLEFTVDGQIRQVSEVAGVRVIDLWATWCGPCVEALPHLDEVAREFADRGVTVLAISVDADIEPLARFFEGVHPGYTVGWAGAATMQELQVRGIPATFVLDAEGTVVDQIQGYGGESDRRLDEALEALLQQ